MQKRKSLSKKRRKQVTILLSTVMGALLIIGILQYAGVVNIFEQTVLDSEYEGSGRIGISSATMYEAQSITINQIEELWLVQLKLSRDSGATGFLYVSYKDSLDGSTRYMFPMPVSFINSGEYNPGWEIVPASVLDVTPGQQIYLIFNFVPFSGSSGSIYFWSSGRTTDPYTGGCEYYKGPSTNNEWVANCNGFPYIDHSFKVYGTSPNQSPTVPATPTGPSTGTPGTNYYFETAGSTDPEGGAVEYKWDRGDGSPCPWSSTLRTLHSWSSTGTYQVKVKARDDLEAESEWSTAATIVISQEAQNQPPSTPSFSAWEDTLNVGEVGTWSAVSSDPDGHNIFYTWEVDGSVARQHGFVPSGTYDSLSYTFASAGDHTISVRVRDTPGLYSGWATKTVSVVDEGEDPEEPSGYQALIYVVDSTTYEGIAGASVICNGELQTTNAQGIATYTLPAETYTATASATGYISGDVSITVTTSGGSASVYLDTTGNGEEPEEPEEPEEGFYLVTVEVFNDITNLPVENAKVTADNTDKFTNSNGVTTYALEGDGNTYSVSVIASGYNSDLKTTTVYDGPKTVSFYLTSLENGEEPEPEPEPAPGIPGFEFMAMIAAIGMVFILFKRKKK